MAGKKKSKNDRLKKDGGKKEGADARVAKAPKAEVPVAKVAKAAKTERVADVAANDGDTGATVETVAVTTVATLSAESARRGPLTEMVPVRFDKQMLADVRDRAAGDHRSVSSWIRRAVDLELQRGS
jgi:hypothetical protein